jgi:hypothetical protein
VAEVFISYRKGENIGALLHDYLDRNLYPGASFLDEKGLSAGTFWPQLIQEINGSRVMLLLITRLWVQRLDDLAKPDDYIRKEILTASQAGVRLLPVLIDNVRPADVSIGQQVGQTSMELPEGLPRLSEQDCIFCPAAANQVGRLKDEHVRGLLGKLYPHLPGYWKRRSEHWRHWCRIAAGIGLAIAVLLLIWVGLLWARVPASTQKVRFTGQLSPEVKSMNVYLRLPAGQVGDGPNLNLWMNDLNDWVSFMNQPGPDGKNGPKDKQNTHGLYGMFVAEGPLFDQHYEDFSVDVNVPKAKYRVTQVFAFLKSTDKESGRPLYRQLKAEFGDDKDNTRLYVQSAKPLEQLFLIVLVHQDVDRPWPDGAGLGLTLVKV